MGPQGPAPQCRRARRPRLVGSGGQVLTGRQALLLLLRVRAPARAGGATPGMRDEPGCPGLGSGRVHAVLRVEKAAQGGWRPSTRAPVVAPGHRSRSGKPRCCPYTMAQPRCDADHALTRAINNRRAQRCEPPRPLRLAGAARRIPSTTARSWPIPRLEPRGPVAVVPPARLARPVAYLVPALTEHADHLARRARARCAPSTSRSHN